MSIRIILTPLFGDDSDAAAAQAAFAVTRRFDAQVAGLFVRIDPLDAIPIVGDGVSPAIIDDLTRAAGRDGPAQRRPKRISRQPGRRPGRRWSSVRRRPAAPRRAGASSPAGATS